MTTQIAHRKFQDSEPGPHHPFIPYEVYPDSGIEALVTTPTDTEFKNARLIPLLTLSPMGAEIKIAQANDEALLNLGAEINLRIRVMGSTSNFFGLVITTAYERSGERVVGVRWCEEPSSTGHTSEKRRTARWLCSEAFLPTGMAPNPARFNDFIYFKVLDLSREGMQLTTSLRNRLLIPGMVLDSVISMPLVGEARVSFKVQNVRIKEDSGKEHLTLGVVFLKVDRHFLESAGQYLLQFGKGVTPASLKANGLSPRSVESAVEFSYVKNAETYLEVLDLRRRAYTEDATPGDDEKNFKWADFYDSKSRIIVGRHEGRCVGTVRLTFHEPGEESEYHQFLKFPDSFPKVGDMLVSGRLCTDPEYRGKDLFDGLIRQMVLTGVQSKRKYILGSAEASLTHLYERAGMKRTGLHYERTAPQKIQLETLLMNVSEVLVGRGISFRWWRRLYRGLFDYVEDFRDFEMTPMDQIRIKTYTLLDRVLNAFGL